jgi:hypothetical protein
MSEITETPAPSALQMARERLQQVQRYKSDGTLVGGIDYGTIPGTSGKPTLLNPGAQKLCALFDLALEIKTVTPSESEKRLSYDVTVALRNKETGGLEFEGVGCCNSNERKYKNQDRDNVANTLLKMAKKRALVDATLGALGISSIFTQDLEDLADNSAAPAAPAAPELATEADLKRYEQMREAVKMVGQTPTGELKLGVATKVAYEKRVAIMEGLLVDSARIDAAKRNGAVLEHAEVAA